VLESSGIDSAERESCVALTMGIEYADYVFMLRKSDNFQNYNTQNEDDPNNASTKRKKKEKEKRKTIIDLFNDTGLIVTLSSTHKLWKKITAALIESGAAYFNLENLQRKISKIERLGLNKFPTNTQSEFFDNNDDEFDFDITEADNLSQIDDFSQYEATNVNHAYKGKTDFEILSDILSLNEYVFTKKKDSSNFVNVYSYLSEILDRKQVENRYDKISVDISSKIIKCCNVSIDAARLVDTYARKYFIFNKFNNRYYDIVDIPEIIDDISTTVDNFKELNEYLKSLTAYKKLSEVIKR